MVGLVRVLVGFSPAFGDSNGGLFGGVEHAGLRDTTAVVGGETGIPLQVFAMFRPMFAVITAALLSGAIADRARFWPWTLFIALWTVFVHVPLAHWIFAFDGYVSEAGGWMATTLGALDLGGGTAVEIDSGGVGAGPGDRARPAPGPAARADAPARPPGRAARRRAAVVRLVRLQPAPPWPRARSPATRSSRP